MIEFIDRQLATTLRDAARYFSVICLTGPRQSGKSTLTCRLFEEYHRVSLENPDIRMSAAADPMAFLNQTNGGLIIDEIQRLPMLLEYIQSIVDAHPERRFVLTGSSNFMLLKNVTESLAGRAGVFDLLPLSLMELRQAGILPAIDMLDETMVGGLYPAVCAGKNISRFLYPAYLRTYLDRDVRQIVNVGNISQFHTFLRLCAGRIGSLFNASELANEVGVSSNTINSWLNVLEASYIIFRLRPWSENTRKRLVKSPKIYFCDTGLACYLLDIETAAQLSRDKMRGHLFENLVIAEALKKRLNDGREPNMFFFRDAKGNEIDLLTLHGGMLSAYEIKSSATYSTDFEKTLRNAATLINTPVVQRTVIYVGDYQNAAGDIRITNWREMTFPLCRD